MSQLAAPRYDRTSAAVLAAALGVSVLSGILVAGDHLLVVAAVTVVLALGLAWLLPSTWLALGGVLLTLLVPLNYFPVPPPVIGFVLGAPLFAIWLVKTPSARSRPVVAGLASILAGWMALSWLLAPMHTGRGMIWLGCAFLFVGCLARPPLSPSGETVRNVLVSVGGLLGTFAILEAFVLKSNPVYGSLFASNPYLQPMMDPGNYRATTLIGHPLLSGSFFAAVAVLAYEDLLRSRSASIWLAGVRFAAITGGLMATKARGAAIAAAVGILFVVLVDLRRRAPGNARRLLALGLLTVLVVATVGVLAGRYSSEQGQLSAQAREDAIPQAEAAMKLLGPTGAGPGQSEAFRVSAGLNTRRDGYSLPIESSYAQFAVALGVIGLGLWVALVVAVIWTGVQRGALGEAGAILALSASVAIYNGFESHPNLFLLLGLLAAGFLRPKRQSRTARPSWP